MGDVHVLPSPPAARGVRMPWEQVPAHVRAAVEDLLGGQVLQATSQAGFSPGSAARVVLADDRRAFVKALGELVNPDSPRIHRREARISAALPLAAPVPRLSASTTPVRGLH